MPLARGKTKVVAIVGPNAVGKSSLGVWLAKKIGGEIVSADSRQVYRGLDIGTGKIAKKEMRGVAHHLLDVADPRWQFSAAQYVKLARAAISKIAARGRIPLIVGGTGFYVDALLGKISLPSVEPNRKLRKKLARYSAKKLFALLKKLDPRRARDIDRYNPPRLIRAIEISQKLGRVPKTQDTPIYWSMWIGLRVPEKELRKRIHKRLILRMRSGMIAEAKRLRKGGLSLRRMRELGLEYRHMADFLDKKTSKEGLLVSLERSNWNYARRQKRWFKRNKEIQWFSPEERWRVEKKVRAFLRKKR